MNTTKMLSAYARRRASFTYALQICTIALRQIVASGLIVCAVWLTNSAIFLIKKNKFQGAE